MPALDIKNCPVRIYNKLREYASRAGRSIPEEALFIIEEKLRMDDQTTVAINSQTPKTAFYLTSFHADEQFIDKRRDSFKEIAKLQPIPTSIKSPNSSEILHQIRKDDAR